MSAATALYFGVLMPYAGPLEAATIVVIGGLFLTALGRALIAIRRHQVARHREWMIRAFALAMGIASVRVVGVVVDVALTPAGVEPQWIFLLSLWGGWGSTLAAAELWIAYTRSAVQPVPVTAS